TGRRIMLSAGSGGGGLPPALFFPPPALARGAPINPAGQNTARGNRLPAGDGRGFSLPPGDECGAPNDPAGFSSGGLPRDARRRACAARLRRAACLARPQARYPAARRRVAPRRWSAPARSRTRRPAAPNSPLARARGRAGKSGGAIAPPAQSLRRLPPTSSSSDRLRSLSLPLPPIQLSLSTLTHSNPS